MENLALIDEQIFARLKANGLVTTDLNFEAFRDRVRLEQRAILDENNSIGEDASANEVANAAGSTSTYSWASKLAQDHFGLA